MKRIIVWTIAAGLALTAASPRPAAAQDVQQRLAAAMKAAAANQQALRAYAWLETTEIRLKGELKSTKVDSCRYGPDGKVQKTPVVQPPPPDKPRGLKGKMVAKKTGDMKEELQATAALIQEYVPPAPDRMQVVINAGTASLMQAGPGRLSLVFPGYVKSGDALSLTFDQAVKALHQIDVKTWLEKPDEPVTFRVTMASLADGTDYPASIVLNIAARQLDVRITKSNYQKLAK